MNPEIENLINMALADGEITEKEREIIIRKAVSLGMDQDEIAMILDGKIALMKKQSTNMPSTKPPSQKEGKIIKCPSCGATVPPYVDKCNDCGVEFRFDSLNKLTGNLTHDSSNNIKEISNYIIPINREALIEFLSFALGNAENKGLGFEIRSAWYSKFTEAYNKASFTFKLPEDVKMLKEIKRNSIHASLDLMRSPEQKLQDIKTLEDAKSPKNLVLILIYFFVAYLMFAFILSWFGKNYWPF